jgi:hypothetical protein
VLRKSLCLLLTLVLLGAVPLAAQTPPKAAQTPPKVDPEVAKGIRQVDEGDYDAAIVTLDGAARRLAADKTRVKDLSQAYLYLGIAYVGKGHEAAAKAKFREAVGQIKDLSLSADRYPPKVINLFEAAKEEANRTAGPAFPRRPAAAPGEPAAQDGGGSKKLLLLGGGAVVAGGGAYLLLKSGDEDFCDSFYRESPGILNASQQSFGFTTTPTSDEGGWRAELTFNITGATAAKSPLRMPPTVFLFAVDANTGQDVGEERLLTPNMKIIEWQGAAGQTFRVGVDLVDASSASYTLIVSGPCL